MRLAPSVESDCSSGPAMDPVGTDVRSRVGQACRLAITKVSVPKAASRATFVSRLRPSVSSLDVGTPEATTALALRPGLIPSAVASDCGPLTDVLRTERVK